MVVATLPGPCGKRIRQGMGAVKIDITVGADHEEALRRHQTHEMLEEGHRGAVGPVEVVEYQHDGDVAGAGDEEPADSVEDAVPLLLGWNRRRRSVGEETAQSRNQLSDGAGGVAEVAAQFRHLAQRRLGLQQLDERTVRR